jgi:alpha-1,2-glucosyltransferase
MILCLDYLARVMADALDEFDKLFVKPHAAKSARIKKTAQYLVDEGHVSEVSIDLLSALTSWTEVWLLAMKHRAYVGKIVLLQMWKKVLSTDIIYIGYYTIIMQIFVGFVYVNDGIVVGDRDAHQVTLNPLQVGYFTLMYGLFSLPSLLAGAKETFMYIRSRAKSALFLSLLFALAVKYKTVAHPYLLADNRHLTFYIWKRIYQSSEIVRYCMIPYYVWVWFFIWNSLGMDFNRRFALIVCTLLNLVPQLLLEFRYFLYTYLILRVWMRQSHRFEPIGESLLLTTVNIFVFFVFVTHTFIWPNTPEAQRIMW